MLNKLIAVAVVGLVGKIGYDVYQSGKRSHASGKKEDLIVLGKKVGDIHIRNEEMEQVRVNVGNLIADVPEITKPSR